MKLNHPRRRGAALVYLTVTLVALMVFVSLVVDSARVSSVKTELQTAADAAARHAVTGLRTDPATARNYAVAAAAQNVASGAAVTLDSNLDIELGVWDSSKSAFTKLTGTWEPSATAVRVKARCLASRGTGVTRLFGGLFGVGSMDASAEAIAAFSKDYSLTVSALACPWLAGMPNGTRISGQGNGVSAPTNSPIRVNIPLNAGQILNFRNTNGQTGDTATGNTYGLDGDTTRTNIKQTAANGINSTTAPLNALVGIFLDDSQPDTTAAAAQLDFSSTSSRNFTTLSPKLKQVFFIGDGLDNKNRLQDFIVPTGATRLYLGVMDENAYWWDNVGSITTTLFTGKASLVK